MFRVRLPSQFMPAAFMDLDAIVRGGGENIAPGEITILVGDILDLIEAGYSVADMTRIGEWLLALVGEGEHALW